MPSKKAMEQASKGLATFSKQSNYLQDFIRKARERKPGASPTENILPNLADYVPLPKDIEELYSTLKLVSQQPEVRKEVLKEVRRGFADAAKDPVGTAKKLAKENPVDAAALIATGGLAGLKKASYALPLHVRSYLRAMGHLPGTSKHLPKRYENLLEQMILAELKEGKKKGYKRPVPTVNELLKSDSKASTFYEEVLPPVRELANRKVIKESDTILPMRGFSLEDLSATLETNKSVPKKEIYNTLGKYYLRVDPKTQDIVVNDFYKFYPWFNPEDQLDTFKTYLKGFKKAIKQKDPEEIARAFSFVRHALGEGVPEALGMKYGGSFPLEYRLPPTTPERAKIRKLFNEARLKQLDRDYVDPYVRTIAENPKKALLETIRINIDRSNSEQLKQYLNFLGEKVVDKEKYKYLEYDPGDVLMETINLLPKSFEP